MDKDKQNAVISEITQIFMKNSMTQFEIFGILSTLKFIVFNQMSESVKKKEN